MLAEAHRQLNAAGALAAGMIVPDVAIAYRLGRVKLELDTRRLRGDSPMSENEVGEHLTAVERLATETQLRLALPEVIAGRGHLCVLNGDRHAADIALANSLAACARQGNALYPSSGRSLVGSLQCALHGRLDDEPEVKLPNPIELIGRRLEPDDLLVAMATMSSMLSVRG
jgi:hypothetical protein